MLNVGAPPDRPENAAAAETLALRLFVAGYEGDDLPDRYARRLARGMAGAILFSRNLRKTADGALDVAHLTAQTARIHGQIDVPVLCAVDQEGGLVARLRAPFTHLPPMRDLGDRGDVELCVSAGRQTGRECAAAGFNVDFAPILDVDTNPQNPIIGRRAFADNPADVALYAGAFLRGLQQTGVLGCGKHFPGHGDTDTDSHLALPVLPFDQGRLEKIEMPPFAKLAAEMPMVMTAHILFPALDKTRPATLSPLILKQLLRKWCGFSGLIVSDDLEMKGVAETFTFADSVRLGLQAGVELFLVCRREDALEEAVGAAAEVLMGDETESLVARKAIAKVDAVRQIATRLRPSKERVVAAIDHDEGRRLRKSLGIGNV